MDSRLFSIFAFDIFDIKLSLKKHTSTTKQIDSDFFFQKWPLETSKKKIRSNRSGTTWLEKLLVPDPFRKWNLAHLPNQIRRYVQIHNLNWQVALKLIEHSKVQTEKEKATIAREIKILKLLDHKNIGNICDLLMPSENVRCHWNGGH